MGESNNGNSLFVSRWKEPNAHDTNPHRLFHTRAVLEALKSVDNSVLLEIGSGSGFTSRGIAELKPGCRVISIDITTEALRLANRVGKSRVFQVQADAFSLPFSDESITASWHEGLIEHFPDNWRQILEEQNRVTQPGGLIITSVPNILNFPRTFAIRVQGERFRYHPADGFFPGKFGSLHKEYRALGLEIVSETGWSMMYPAMKMYEWDPVKEEKKYPLYTRVFHYLGNLADEPLEALDGVMGGVMNRWFGFEFMIVGRKPI